ncbi:hypothetical protein GCM10009555_015040 [Acrocarpospora macrocephala]
MLGVRLELFTAGSDGGTDLRYMSHTGEKIVIQCKHWMKSGRSKLIGHMLKTELPKVRKLRPTRYIVASTVDMTIPAKDKLYTSFQPYVKSPSDLFGIDEITSLIKGHPDVIRKHIRLWLNDSNVLDAAISKNIFVRSQHFADEVKGSVKTYVSTSKPWAGAKNSRLEPRLYHFGRAWSWEDNISENCRRTLCGS